MDIEWQSRLAVDDRKIAEYLLSGEHPLGRFKAGFFRRFGFTIAAVEVFRGAILQHAREAELISVEQTEFGRKYVLQGPLRSPDGRDPVLRSVWFESTDLDAIMLVTTYPAGERR